MIGLATLASLATLVMGLAPAPAQAVPATPIQGNTVCGSKTTLRLSASPAQVNLGQSSTLTWSMAVPAGCEEEVLILKLDGVEVPASGRKLLAPVRSGTHKLTLGTSPTAGADPAKTAGASVNVLYPPPGCGGMTAPVWGEI